MRWFVLVAVAAVAAVSTIVLQTGFVTFSRWRLIVRDSSYRALVRDFHQAFPFAQRVVEGGSAGWDFEVPLPGTDVRARVRARSHMAVVTVKYSDESQDREMYQYQDYSNPVSLRTRGPILYVHWAETLFGTDHWVLAYDLAARRELSRERIVPGDIRMDE